MPPTALVKRLEPASDAAFYQLVRGYADELTSLTVSIYMACDLIATHLKRLGDASFHDPAYRDHLVAVTESNAEYVQTITADVRHFFWYDPVRDTYNVEADNAYNRERWQPYDSAAWDRLWETIVGHFAPVLDDLEKRLHPLDALEQLDQHPLDPERAGKIKGIKHRLIDESLQRFHVMLGAEQYAASLPD